MCGIVGAVAQREVAAILLEGLRRLEYRGYDSAGLAVIQSAGDLSRRRAEGKVRALEESVAAQPLTGATGIAHTRWATHGQPTERNAHPHLSGDSVALVHNGIIENHEQLRAGQSARGYAFTSDTDTESIVHLVHEGMAGGEDLLVAVQATVAQLEGAYALAVVSSREPGRMVGARRGSPLVVGLGIGENFLASDVFALLPVTQRFIFLEEGDVADIRRDRVVIHDGSGQPVERPVRTTELAADAVERGSFRHYMLKEIFEQPTAIAQTLEGRTGTERVYEHIFGPNSRAMLDSVTAVQIVACGTSYHAGLVARHWLESIANVPCFVEVASEFRYRKHIVPPAALFVTISQSGETADTLAALRQARQMGFRHTLSICNVPESSLVRESDLVLMTRAGPEIGVASTKAFTTQLTALLLLMLVLGRRHGMSVDTETEIVHQMRELPGQLERVLELSEQIRQLAEDFADKHHALFLGRAEHHPIAMEGALKLKEISYIHAEAYPAGELKHGPLALIDAEMPVIAVAPGNALLGKLKSNLQEVRARGGQLYVFADRDAALASGNGVRVLPVERVPDIVSPIVYTLPLQLLAYYVAVLKGTDVDQPRNLAKSVTVE